MQWSTANDDRFDAADEAVPSDLTSAFYLETAQNVPSIAGSDSASEDEEILFSSIHHADEDASAMQKPAKAASSQLPAKLHYSWQPELPGTARNQLSQEAEQVTQSQGHTNARESSQSDNPVASASVAVQDMDHDSLHNAPNAAGWLTGAAGQLAASRSAAAETSQQTDVALNFSGDADKMTEQEVERAFQQEAQSADISAADSQCVQLVTAIHDSDIDRLLQKLVCGEIDYNPHDSNSGLPPASSLFTDSEASSEAEEDPAGHLLHDKRSSQRVSELQAAKRAALQPQPAASSFTSRAATVNAGVDSQSKGMQKPSVIMRSSQQSSPSSQQTTQPQKAAGGTFMRHRQSSRLANRFQRQADYDAENNVAEEFNDWREKRARLKTQQSRDVQKYL